MLWQLDKISHMKEVNDFDTFDPIRVTGKSDDEDFKCHPLNNKSSKIKLNSSN